MTDDRDERTRLLDHEIWVATMEGQTPNEVTGYSRFMLPGEIAAAFGLSLAYSVEEHPILQRYEIQEVVDSIERTLRFESNARGTAAGSTAN